MIPIARKEMRDALRNRWLIGYTAALAVLGLAAALAGNGSAAGLGLQMYGRTTATLTNLCLLLAPLIALAMGAASIAGERDRGTLEHLLAQPLDRHELLGGKYLGLLASLLVATIAGFLPAAVPVAAAAGGRALLGYLLFPLLSGLLIAAMLGLGMLVSVRSGSGVQAQGLAILLWFAFVLLYDLLLMGILVGGGLGSGGLAALLLLNPVDAARVLVVLALEPDLYLLGPAGALLVGRLSPHGAAVALLSTLLIWAVVPLAAAWLSFRLRPPRRRALTRMSRRRSTADTERRVSTALRSVGALDVRLEYDCERLGRAPCSHAPLRALAANGDETRGLEARTSQRLPTAAAAQANVEEMETS